MVHCGHTVSLLGGARREARGESGMAASVVAFVYGTVAFVYAHPFNGISPLHSVH